MRRVIAVLGAILALMLLFLALRGIGVIPRQEKTPSPPTIQTVPTPPPPAQEPVPEPEALPVPIPLPQPEPFLPVTVEGIRLDTVLLDDARYLPADRLADALGMEYTYADGALELTGLRPVRFVAGDGYAVADGGEELLNRAPFEANGRFYLPLEDTVRLLQCARYTDVQTGTEYVSCGGGDWAIPPDRDVKILEYHAVGDNIWGIPELFVSVAELDAQITYLIENGYDLIWFEDLRDLSRYDKPVILTFDDGYDDNYTELLPVLQKHQAKATVFMITNDFGIDYKLTEAQAQEMVASGLVSLQSHGMTHHDMSAMDRETLREELRESQRRLTQLTGKVPYVVCYPEGKYAPSTLDLIGEYYKFGVKMVGGTYHTSDDPLLANRYYIPRSLSMEAFIARLEE